MFWKINTNTETPTNTNIEEISTWEEIAENDDNTIDLEAQSDSFEDDVIRDLEWLFSDNNGYEDVQWEYWFTDAELE